MEELCHEPHLSLAIIQRKNQYFEGLGISNHSNFNTNYLNFPNTLSLLLPLQAKYSIPTVTSAMCS